MRVRVGSSRDLVIRNNQLGRDYCIQLIFMYVLRSATIMYVVKIGFGKQFSGNILLRFGAFDETATI